MLGQLLDYFGRHKPSKRLNINRGDGRKYAICRYCKHEIMQIGTFKWVRV